MAKTTNGIVYPSDYGAVADIPNDLKRMAESIDKLLNKYSLVTESGNQIRLVFNDTTNKFKAILNDKNGNKLSESDEIDLGINVMITDIAYNDKKLIITLKNGEIKSVSISSLIDGLVKEDDFNKLSDKNVVIENELTELASQMPWNTTEVSKSVHIEDSAKYSRNKLDVFGDLVQEKREGYNVLNTENLIEQNSLGVNITKNSDGTINFNGTATGGISIKLIENLNKNLSGNYTLILRLISGSMTTTNLRMSIGNSSMNSAVNETGRLLSLITSTTKNIWLTSGEINDVLDNMYMYINSGSVFNSCKFSILLVQGTYTEDTIPPYEQYGAMPSIEYPSMPQVVTGMQKISKIGKNLCNGINQHYFLYTDCKKCGFNINNNGLIIAVEEGKNYTISTLVVQERYRIACLNDIPINSIEIIAYNGKNQDNTDNSVTINTTGYKYLVVNATDLASIQIELSDTATSYEPYKEEIINLDLKDTELCKITDENGNIVAQDRIVYKDGKFQFEKNIRKVVIDGVKSKLQMIYTIDNDKKRFITMSNYKFKETASDLNLKAYCSHFKLIESYGTWNKKEGFTTNGMAYFYSSKFSNYTNETINLWAKEQYDAGNPITIIAPIIKSIYEDCTAEQSEVLDKLYKLSLQKGTNNIFIESKNGLTAELQLEYMQDLQSKLSQLEAMIVANASEEV